MRLGNPLNRIRRYLRPSRPKQLREKFQNHLRLEELEDRMVLSTLYIDAFNNASYFGNSGLIGDNLT
ncbi:MAG TPA: hypothetical protein VGZ73_31230, partial [Bryobacteraceae bacterium]|nr:hypothetical protein [Bryobacteraceae bacterium]